jgi:hypothetical protein
MHRFLRQARIAYLSLDDPEEQALQNRYSRFLKRLVFAKSFEAVSTFCNLANMVFLSLDHHGKSHELATFLELQVPLKPGFQKPKP